ncbi:unnamed protein product [Adineta steineri]|uniref:NAD(P)(+)--arginine ADP-ribosyltransferase n=1 Tax=Adineta steineri TaxID=433720 RepID=A0A813T2X2_9BILA|nr:unnamed protein product [Adineta steineri]CAF1281723.1 unnamed protein product [Adineta steineri]
MWSQLITEVLLRSPQSSEAKAEMIAECRLSYKDNEAQLKNIEIFEKSYRENEAIEWYTKNGFIFQLFNKAFRRQDFEVIFKYRYFLLDLFKEIHSLYVHQYQNVEHHLTVYRGQMMWKSELMKIKQNVGHLISINTFFSTSISSIVAANFCGDGEYESEGIVSVIFEIKLDGNAPSRPFAQIEKSSVNEDEREVLFSMGTVFHIENVDLETDTIWLVKLTWNHQTQEKLEEMKQLTGLLDFYTRQRIGDRPSILMFGYFLSEMGLLRQALRFYTYLCKALPKDHSDRGILYNNLGEVLRKLNYFNRARYQFEKALEFCTDTMSIYHPFWAIIHSNIALLNFSCRKPKEALKCYRSAAFILSRYTAYNDECKLIYIEEALAIIYHGMGAALIYLAEYQNAIAYQQKALKIELRILPNDHPTLIESYYELGNLYMKSEEYVEALKNFETALRIAQKNLLEKDQRYIWLHVNIAILTFYVERDTSKTLKHCSDALEIIEQTNIARSSNLYPDVYQKLAILYFNLNLLPLAFSMWEQYMQTTKYQAIAQNNHIDLSEVCRQVNIIMSSETNSKLNPNYLLLHQDNSHEIISIPKLESMGLCEFADKCRSTGYISYAIRCYLCLLEQQPVTNDPHFDQVHKSRLHNNLAACYQDLDDNEKALYHYQSALDILTVENKEGSLQTAIIHYNIALIHFELDELNRAEEHLHKSLAQYKKQLNHQSDILDVKIYIALIKIYQRWSNWHMVCNYYQCIVDQMKIDRAEPSIIEKYEKLLQNAIEKINVD